MENIQVMIIYKGRDRTTNWPIIEKDGNVLPLPSYWTSPSRRLRSSIRSVAFSRAIIEHWLGAPPPKWTSTEFANRFLGGSDSGNLIRRGYTISDEKEAEMKEAAIAIAVARKMTQGNKEEK